MSFDEQPKNPLADPAGPGPADPRTAISTAEEISVLETLTDEDVRALNAMEKADLMRWAIKQAVAKYLGVWITPEETKLVVDYRQWRKSPRAVTGVFHWRRPTFFDEEGN